MLLKSLFMRLILVFVLAVLAIRVLSCSHVQDGNELGVTGKDIPAAQQELPDGFPTTSTKNMGLGGRKMAFRKDQKKETEKDQGFQGGSSEDISGMDDDDATKKFLGESQDKLNDQDQKNPDKLKRKTLKSACLGTPSTEPNHVPSINSKYYLDSKSVPDKTNLESPSRSDRQLSPKGKTQRLLEATTRIVNLIHKDYSGMNRPRHKPPINNHVPIH